MPLDQRWLQRKNPADPTVGGPSGVQTTASGHVPHLHPHRPPKNHRQNATPIVWPPQSWARCRRRELRGGAADRPDPLSDFATDVGETAAAPRAARATVSTRRQIAARWRAVTANL